jgi:hypothetical protein
MMRTEMVRETFVFSPFNHVTQLLTRESFIEFIRHEGLDYVIV